MDTDLETAYNVIVGAVSAEDIFGDLVDPEHKKSSREMLEFLFQRLSKTVNTELYTSPDDRESAWEANEKLNQFYESAQTRLGEDLYGIKRQPPSLMKSGHLAFTTSKRQYYMGNPIAQGTIATIYEGECAISETFAGKVAIKIIDDGKDNEFAIREMRVLRMLHASNGAQRKHLPVLLDHFRTEDERAGLILRYLEDCYDLRTVQEHSNYRNGIDPKHMVWMLRRFLSAIGYAHSLGIVHGNIEPSHLFIRPRDHNLFVIDWSWAAVDPKHTGDRFQIETEIYSAPEVQERRSPTPAADIYSIGKCMIEILGGDVETNEMPDSVPEELQRFLEDFVRESPLQRAQDAWQLHGSLVHLVGELWGKRKFLVFPM
jgi:serine/threonine protein kinase